MRPGDFSPGNAIAGESRYDIGSQGFNEAGGFLPRKRPKLLSLVLIWLASLQ